MVKNKKIISLVAALAMIFSMFSAFTVVNAADKGIALTGSLSTDGKTITVEATPTGTEAKLGAWQIDLNIPDGVTLDDIEVTSVTGVTPTTGMVNGRLQVGFLDLSGNGVEFSKLATIKIKLAAPLAADYAATLNADSSIADANGEVKVGKGTMTAAVANVAKWVDPNKKPDTVTRPGEETIPATPDVPTPVLPTKKGIELSGSVDKAGTTITVEAKPKDTEAKLGAWQIDLNIPDGVTLDDIEVTSVTGVTPTTGMVNGRLQIGFLDLSGNGVEFDKLATIKIKLAAPLATNYVAELNADSSIADANGEVKVGKGTMEAATAVITPSEDKPKPVKTAALKNFVDKDGAAVAKAAEDASKATYMTVEVKKDGAAATYGSDFIALYDGQEIKTVEEYNNIIHGYVADKPISDVINKLTYQFFNSAKYTISTTLNAVGEETQLTQPVNKEVGGKADPTPTPAPPAGVKVTADKTTISTDGTARITATVTDSVEVVTPGTEVKFTIASGDAVLDFDGVNEATVALDADKKASIRAYAKKTGTATVKAAYTYTDKDGEQTKEGTITIKVQTAVVGGGDSTDKKGSGGTIAGPADTIGTGGILGGFTDLDSVDWAKSAITVLSLKGIVSGRGDGTFAPNDNITRAEYCQILIGAIEKTAEYADSEFADVPSDAWFYHSVSVASKYGIVSGYGDGNFGPYDLITRQDMALMTYKAAQVMNKDLSAVRTMSFADAGAISGYAATAVQTLADASIINGVSDTEFAPRANATRAQAAKILYDTFVK